jgi:exopolyphosphatase/guanosine-5'-triphosphate,3'-diphosphate pyrophosphatase
MEWAGVNNMLVPDIGLKDGMLQTLFEDFFDELNSTPQAGHPAQVPVPDLQNQPAELE